MKKHLLALATLIVAGLCGCSEDFHYDDFVIVDESFDFNKCIEKFDITESVPRWSYYYSNESYIQKDICRKATDFFAENGSKAECVAVTSNGWNSSYNVAMEQGGEISVLQAYVQECEFILGDADEYDFVKTMNAKFLDPCLCKMVRGEIRYLESDDPIVVGDLSNYSSTSSSIFPGYPGYSSGSSGAPDDKVQSPEPQACPEIAQIYDHDGYTVAYEFDDPSDLGKDYIGNNNAKHSTLPFVDGDCNNLVLNGTNGLFVPLTDTFRNKNFVVEVRFNADEAADMGNIFVAEPPGRGVDGWQIRLDGDVVDFHIRDADLGEWDVISVGKISMKEWHVVRVELLPKEGSGLKNVLTIKLDGETKYSKDYVGDVSQIKYNLGIGYDSQNQSAYNRKFFKGKIDYIRYGAR